MAFSSLIGNNRIKQWLQQLVLTQRLPGAMIFTGLAGVGKYTFALQLAKALNCRQLTPTGDSCDKCPVCHRIQEGIFLDLKILKPDGQFIKIDQVREITNEIYLRPFEGHYRVYIIDEAEKLREQAANALLKTLEEPPHNTVLILVTANSNTLLPTIRSRAMQIRFSPINTPELEQYLRQHSPRPAAELQLLSHLAQGSLGQAQSCDLSQYYTDRQQCLELLDLLLNRRLRPRLIKAAEYFGRKEREEFIPLLKLCQLLLHDLIALNRQVPTPIINHDINKQLAALAKVVGFPVLAYLNDHLNQLHQDLTRNVNRQLALERIFLDVLQYQATTTPQLTN
jgi:DNA polymerase III subunit delta'